MGPSGISYFVYDKSCKQIKLLECDALALCLFKHEAKWNKLFFCLWQIPQKYAAHAWLHFTHVWLLGQSDCSFPTTEETHDVSFNEQICFPRIILAGPRKRKRNWNALEGSLSAKTCSVVAAAADDDCGLCVALCAVGRTVQQFPPLIKFKKTFDVKLSCDDANG